MAPPSRFTARLSAGGAGTRGTAATREVSPASRGGVRSGAGSQRRAEGRRRRGEQRTPRDAYGTSEQEQREQDCCDADGPEHRGPALVVPEDDDRASDRHNRKDGLEDDAEGDNGQAEDHRPVEVV